MGFWSLLFRRQDHTAAPLAKIEEEKVAVQEEMEKGRPGLRREAQEVQGYRDTQQRLINEFEIAAKAATAATSLRRQRRERG